MARQKQPELSRRERQILDVLYRRGGATAAEVLDELPDPPSYSAIRALLRILEDKGHARHEEQGQRYVYFPTVNRERAKQSAFDHLVSTFFEGSEAQALVALVDQAAARLSDEELDRLSERIKKAKQSEREKEGL